MKTCDWLAYHLKTAGMYGCWDSSVENVENLPKKACKQHDKI